MEDLQILATAGQAALYAFSSDTREWTAREIEGTFFLIENHGAPPLQFVILNQKGGLPSLILKDSFKVERRAVCCT